MENDAQRFVLPVLLAVLILGAFMILVTSGGSDEPAGAVDRPVRPSPATRSGSGATTPRPPAPTHRFVKVRPGDTASSIAATAGMSTERLLELNPSADPDALKPGQTLKLAP